MMIETVAPEQQVRTNSGVPVHELMAVLSDNTRLGILFILSSGERNVAALCKELNLPQPSVSHHLGILRHNSVVACRRAGKQVIYSLNDAETAEDGSLTLFADRCSIRISSRIAAA